MNLIKKIWRKFNQPKPYLVENFTIVPAFELDGEVYYMHQDPLNISCGRGLAAMVALEELLMRCDSEYLKLHIAAVEKLMSQNRINILQFSKLHNHLKERVNLLVAVPEHIYKLASIVFFTKEESPFAYDVAFNQNKLEKWKQNPDMHDFFLQTPLKTLLPFLEFQENSRNYTEVIQAINNHHKSFLQEVLSENMLKIDTISSYG